MGLIVRTAVDHRAVGGRHLDHGTVIVLSKGIGGQVDGTHILRLIDQGPCIGLPRQVDPCPGAKAEHLLVFAEPLLSQHGHDLHQRVITGLHQGFGHIQPAMAAGLHTVDHLPIDLLEAIAFKALFSGEHPLLQGRRYGKDLLRGSRLIGIADAEIPPHLVPGYLGPQ